MFQGFYDLTSNMITQNRVLNVISNNMANVSTPGYKSDTMIQSTFRDQMIYRYDRAGKTPVGAVSRVNTATERVTSYNEGGLRETGSPLDVGLTGNGFFVIQTNNGIVYSRNGSFNLDDERYLNLAGVGRVMGMNGPIQLPTDNVSIDKQGLIIDNETMQRYGRIRVVDFANYNQLTKVTGGVFRSAEAAQNMNQADIHMTQKCIESSNVSPMDEMTAMMTGQRALQSSAQLLKMYDQITDKAVQLGSM